MKVYSMNISGINPRDKKWYSYLSDKRIEKVQRLKNDRKKAQSIGAELLLRHALCEITGEDKNASWDTDDKGKLYLTEYPDIYVNLSHSGDYAVCAVNNTPVGIDIQYMRDYNEGLVRRYFTADEEQYILRNKKTAFYEVWTRKESFLKAVGKGLTVPLKSFSVLENEIYYEGSKYKFKEYRVGENNYLCFACFASSPE